MTQPARRPTDGPPALEPRTLLLYHFCRMQLPRLTLAAAAFERHLRRTFDLFHAKTPDADWASYLRQLYALDWFVCCACLESDKAAWERLFAARASRADCLLVDALRARAVRLYPRDEEKQESAVSDFWSQLLVADRPTGTAVLARYDGQRPLVPWLIRVFQNWHISQLRQRGHTVALPDDDLALPLPEAGDDRWHESFGVAAREWLAEVGERDLLVLGLRLRYRLSQREVAELLGVHEGNISRQTAKLRDRCLEHIGRRLLEQGWTGDDLSGYVLKEMGGVLLDEPRLSADRLARLLAVRGKELPAAGVFGV